MARSVSYSALVFVLLFLSFLSKGASFYDTTVRPADYDSAQYLPILQGKTVVVVINQSSVVGGRSLLDIFIRHHVNVKAILVPEHGFRGASGAGETVTNSADSATGLPIISLYGTHKKPVAADLAGVDILVYDLQDVGVRFYTYISTLQYCMEACAQYKVPMLLLDRPDPNGFYVDGPGMNTENKSFVGLQNIPVVYGMTAGEYARMLLGERSFPGADTLNLSVVKCQHYTHLAHYRLPVPPSPNLRTMAAIYAYPSLCLFEGTKISVGRGTPQPFTLFGSPELRGAYTDFFVPQAPLSGSGKGKTSVLYAGDTCFGQQVADNEVSILKKLNNKLNIDWLASAYNAYPDKDKFFNSFFPRLYGDTLIINQLRQQMPTAEIRKTWEPGLEQFRKIRKKYLLYPDFE